MLIGKAELLLQELNNVRIVKGDSSVILDSYLVKNVVAVAEQSLVDKGRVLLRKSGTEPLILVMVEGEDPLLTRRQAELIAEAVQAASA